MKKLIKAAALGLALAGMSTSATAFKSERYDIDEAHTSVLFFVNHLGFSNMQGEINDVEGTLYLDRKDFSKSKVKAVMKASSVDMDHKGLNEHLASKDFFDAAKFTTLTFTSTKVTKKGGDKAVMQGNLEMLGKSLPVTLDVTLSGQGENPISKKQTVAFHATGKLDRTKWGMDFYAGAIGTEITIQIDAELVLAD